MDMSIRSPYSGHAWIIPQGENTTKAIQYVNAFGFYQCGEITQTVYLLAAAGF